MGENYEGQVPPVLLIVFRRPELTRKMLDSIRAAKPARLYVACDGPRAGRPDDEERVWSVRAIVAEYENDLHPITRYQTQNLGCGKGVSTAISWFFEHEEEGIILEDDCYPDPSFYRYCGELLSLYRNDTRVMYVSGYNFFHSISTMADSYRFTKFGWQWGWATWRRSWAFFDMSLTMWPEFTARKLHLSDAFDSERVKRINRLRSDDIDTWDYQWGVCTLMQNGLGICPTYSLVTNIGVGFENTHGNDLGYAQDLGVPVRPMDFPLKHPPFVFPDMEYDRQVMQIASSKYSRTRALMRAVCRWFNSKQWW